MQKISLFHLFVFEIKSILESCEQRPDWPHPFLMILSQKIFDQVLSFVNLYQHAKNQLIPSVHSCNTVNFRVQTPDWSNSFLTMPNQKVFSQLLIFFNLHEHAKNEAVSSICSCEILDLKILQPDWLRVFWPISKEQDFSQI